MTLPGILMGGENKDTRTRLCPDHVIHNSTQTAELFHVISLSQFVNMTFVRVAEHPAACDLHAGGVCYDRLLEGNLRAVGKACHHGRLLSPTLCKAFLGCWVTVWIMQTFDVPAE